MKKMLIGIWTVCFLAFTILLTSYLSNEKRIANYNDGHYEKNSLGFLGFTQPYIDPYNEGNGLYRQNEFDKAIECYDKALRNNPSRDKECKIRINKTLAMLQLIDYENVNDENVDEIIKSLENAKEVLLEKGCATDSNDGHNDDAQQLKNEIDDIIKSLKNTDPDDANDKKDQDPQEQKPDDSNSPSGAKDKLKELEEIQNDGQRERYEQDRNNFDFDIYDGECW